MNIAEIITNDIYMNNSFGDLVIEGSDIVQTNSKRVTVLQVIIDRLNTSLNDYIIYNFGANLDGFLGKGMSKNLIESMEYSIMYSLTHDSFLSSDIIEIITVPIEQTYLVRLIISLPEGEETITIKSDNRGIKIG